MLTYSHHTPVTKLPKPNAPPVSAALFQPVVRVSHAKKNTKIASWSQPPCGVGANDSVLAAPAASATR